MKILSDQEKNASHFDSDSNILFPVAGAFTVPPIPFRLTAFTAPLVSHLITLYWMFVE